LPNHFPFGETKEPIQKGLGVVYDCVFNKGFDAPGTYTRIEDHRILLVPERCRIQLVHTDGWVNLDSISPIQVDGKRTIVYRWHAGLKGLSKFDPLAIAQRLYSYVQIYAPSSGRAKSKSALTYAIGADHLLGCQVIDEMVNRNFMQQMKDDFGGLDLFCVGPGKLAEDDWATFTEIVVAVAKRKKPGHASFRVFFEAIWSENKNC
jgi:hypothetical protein